MFVKVKRRIEKMYCNFSFICVQNITLFWNKLKYFGNFGKKSVIDFPGCVVLGHTDSVLWYIQVQLHYYADS